MENLDSTVLATALPAIAHAMGESPLRLNLGITSYLFSLAVSIASSARVQAAAVGAAPPGLVEYVGNYTMGSLGTMVLLLERGSRAGL